MAETSDSLSRPRERARVRARARELRQTSPDAERALWQALRARQLDRRKFRRQHPLGPYVADFACLEAQLVIELDGGQHFEDDAMAADARRTAWLNSHGFQVLRFTNLEVLTQREAVLVAILNWLDENCAGPHLDPVPQAGEGTTQ